MTVKDGIYNILLGAIEPLTSDIFDDGVAWLEVAILEPDTTIWETLSPRQLITAIPYALKAGDADSLQGFSAGALDQWHWHSCTGWDPRR